LIRAGGSPLAALFLRYADGVAIGCLGVSSELLAVVEADC